MDRSAGGGSAAVEAGGRESPRARTVWGIALVAVLVLTVCGLAVTYLLVRSSGDEPSPPPAAPSSTPSLPALTADEAAELAAGLASGDPERVRRALTVPADQPLDQALVDGLAGQRSISIDTTTFVTTSDEAATVDAVLVDAAGTSVTWRLTLLYADDGWRIAATAAVTP